MHRLITTTITLALATGLAASPALAKGHSFKLYRDATINGSQLKGQKTYRLELNGNDEALIYRNHKLVTTAPVEVKPITDGISRNAVVLDSDGTILAIHTKKHVVVFVQKPKTKLPGGASLRPRLLPWIQGQPVNALRVAVTD